MWAFGHRLLLRHIGHFPGGSLAGRFVVGGRWGFFFHCSLRDSPPPSRICPGHGYPWPSCARRLVCVCHPGDRRLIPLGLSCFMRGDRPPVGAGRNTVGVRASSPPIPLDGGGATHRSHLCCTAPPIGHCPYSNAGGLPPLCPIWHRSPNTSPPPCRCFRHLPEPHPSPRLVPGAVPSWSAIPLSWC